MEVKHGKDYLMKLVTQYDENIEPGELFRFQSETIDGFYVNERIVFRGIGDISFPVEFFKIFDPEDGRLVHVGKFAQPFSVTENDYEVEVLEASVNITSIGVGMPRR